MRRLRLPVPSLALRPFAKREAQWQPRRRVDAVFPIGTSTAQPRHTVGGDCSSAAGAYQYAIRRDCTE